MDVKHKQVTRVITHKFKQYSVNVERTQINGQLAYASSICSADLSFHVCHTVVEENLFFNQIQAVVESANSSDSINAAHRCVVSAVAMRS